MNNYEKKYKDLVEAVKQLQKANPSDEGIQNWINDNVPELAGSEGERIRKAIHIYLDWLDGRKDCAPRGEYSIRDMISWLGKQGENDSNKMPIWKHWKDGIAGNGEGKPIYLVKIGNTYSLNSCLWFECDYIELSELDNLMLEKQGEQSLADKAEPKFNEGDWVVYKNDICQIVKREEGCNKLVTVFGIEKELVNERNLSTARLWTIQDAKDGDVLCTYECDEPKIVFILKGTPKKHYALSYHCYYNIMYPHFASDSEKGCLAPNDEDVKPATKEQRELLFQKMHEAGYEWDAESKELNKFEDEEYNDEDYGIDGLYHAQRILEKTLGKVDGYQTDDGILSHQCAITAVKKLYEQKSAEWSKKDEDYYDAIIAKLEVTQDDAALTDNQMEFLKSLKQRHTWKPSKE